MISQDTFFYKIKKPRPPKRTGQNSRVTTFVRRQLAPICLCRYPLIPWPDNVCLSRRSLPNQPPHIFHAAFSSDPILDSSVRSSGMYSNIRFTRASHHPAAFCALPYGSLLVPFIAFIRLLSIFCIISEIYYLSRQFLNFKLHAIKFLHYFKFKA